MKDCCNVVAIYLHGEWYITLAVVAKCKLQVPLNGRDMPESCLLGPEMPSKGSGLGPELPSKRINVGPERPIQWYGIGPNRPRRHKSVGPVWPRR